jgi:broad specificity phosphatase PhoE
VCYNLEQVLLARHGRTEWNEQRRRQGQLDSPLLASSAATTGLLSRLVAEQAVDAVFSSPLGRALSTAEIFGQTLGLPVIQVAELSELHHGEMAGLTAAQIEQRYPGELGRRSKDKYEWRFPGGESYADADRRAALALTKIAGQTTGTALIVSHEMIGRVLLRNLLDLDPTVALATAQPNDVLYRVDVRAQTFTAVRRS